MPKEARKLTKSTLDALLYVAQRDKLVTALTADSVQRGLYAQTRRGKVFWTFIYAAPNGGPRRRMQLGTYPSLDLEQARSLAHELWGKVKHGIDPSVEREERERETTTVADAVAVYLKDLRERAESGVAKRGKRGGLDTARKLLESYVLPQLGSVKVRELSEQEVRRMHAKMGDKPVTANRMLTALSAVYGIAAREGMVEPGFNPTRYVERHREDGERRALDVAELQALGRALRAAEDGATVNPSAVLACRLLALTGFRRGELLGHAEVVRRNGREGLRWGDVDLESGIVTLHDSKTGRQKRVIGRAAVELLRNAKPEDAQPHHCVCPGLSLSAPLVGFDKLRLRMYRAAGLEGVDAHSLRHSFASIGAQLDSGRYIGAVSALLGHGHQSKSITERYITSNPQALRPAADAIAAEIARLLGIGELAEVLPFAARA